jgi:hypothetical protein
MHYRQDILYELDAHLSPARAEELATVVESEAKSLFEKDHHQFTTDVLDGDLHVEATYETPPDGSGSLTLRTTTPSGDDELLLAREYASVLEFEVDAANLLTQAFVVALTHWGVKQKD